MKKTSRRFVFTSYLLSVCFLLHASLMCAQAQILPMERGMPFKKLSIYPAQHQLPENCYKINLDKFGYLWVSTQRGLFFYNGNAFEKLKFECTNEDFIYSILDGYYLVLWNYLGDIFRVDTRTHRCIELETNASWNRQARLYNYYFHVNDSIYLVRFSGASVVIPAHKFLSSATRMEGRQTEIMPAEIPGLLEKKYPKQFTKQLNTEISNHRFNLWINDSDFCLGQKIFAIYQDKTKPIFTINGKGNYICAYWKRNNELWVNISDGRLLYYPDYRRSSSDSIVLANDIQGVTMCEDRQGNLFLSTLENGIIQIPEKMTRTTYYPISNDEKIFSSDIRFIHVDRDELVLGHKKPVVDVWRSGKSWTRFALPDFDKADPVRLFYRKGPNTNCLVTNHAVELIDKSGMNSIFPAGDRIFATKDAYLQRGVAYISIKLGTYVTDTIGKQVKAHIGFLPNHTLSFCPSSRPGFFLLGTPPQTSGSIAGNKGKHLLVNKIRNYGGEILMLTASGLFSANEKDLNSKPRLLLNRWEIIDVLWDSSDHYFVLCPYELIKINRSNKHVTTLLAEKDLGAGLRFNTFCLHDSIIYAGCNKGILAVGPYRMVDTLPQRIIYVINKDSIGSNYFARNTTCIWQKGLEFSFKFDIPQVDDFEKSYWVIFDDANDIIARGKVQNGACNFVPPRPGHYEICICPEGGKQRAHISGLYSIDILPRWWQSTLVQMLMALVLITIIAYSCFGFARRLQEKKYQRLRQRHNYLSVKNKLHLSRLKPHFIFNAFNPLQKFIIFNQQQEALNYISEFSALMRNSISIFDKDYISLSVELEFLSQYINIQKERFEDTFDFNTNIDSSLDLNNTFLPPMILQPILENSIEYGVSMWSGLQKGYVSLRIIADHDAMILYVTIEDNGPGYPLGFELEAGHGLHLIVERIQLISSNLGTGSILFTNGVSGALTKISLPLIISPDQETKNGKI